MKFWFFGPLWGKKKSSSNIGLFDSKEPARQHNFNEAIGKLIRFCGAEKLLKMCQMLMVWFGWTIFGTIQRISQAQELGSKPCCLSVSFEYFSIYINWF
jgi:hypothetical protein